VRAGQLSADLRDLLGSLALRQHDLGESDAAQAVEIERVVGTEHVENDHIRAGRLKGARAKSIVLALKFFGVL